jgi:sulfite oxidase
MNRKHPDFVVRSESPFNGGPPVRELIRSHVTPADLFFSRNHGNIPEVNVDKYRLEVTGQVSKPISFSLDEIKSRFARVEIPATLQCAGNRREEMMALKPIPNELPWGTDAISHADWAGARLGDVLTGCGLESEADSRLHVDFVGLDETERLGKRFQYGGSIPLTKALKNEVILAYEMNGEALVPLHGAPLRVVVPGYIGARSVKWLERITVQDEPSQNYFQRKAYRLFPPETNAKDVQWDEGMMLGELNVTSVICSHEESAGISAGLVIVEGYAMAGGDRHIVRVDVSSDGGRTWTQAGLSDESGMWSWQLWKVELNLQPGQHQLIVRAVDSSANSQPQEISQVWNFKGYMNNAWHRVNVMVT